MVIPATGMEVKMPKNATTIDATAAPARPTGNVAYAKQKAEYDTLVQPLVGNPDKVIAVDVDTSADETPRGVMLSLTYAAKRAGFEGRAWSDGEGRCYLAHATEEDRKRRQYMRQRQSKPTGPSATKPSEPEATKAAEPDGKAAPAKAGAGAGAR